MAKYRSIKCVTCNGTGIVDAALYSGELGTPTECRDCNGSGTNVKYESGVIAKYPGGPFLGMTGKAAE